MKKLIEIPFNHELIGQPGIEVKYRNGGRVLNIHCYNNTENEFCVVSVDEEGEIWNHLKTGNFLRVYKHKLDLIMYKEVEEKEPKEIFFVEAHPNSFYGIAYSTLEQACLYAGNRGIKITKFIEVIE